MATAYIAKIPEFTGKDNDTSPQEWLDKVQKAKNANAGLKDKLIKKVRPHALEDLATAIRHAKNYKIAIEEANHTKFVNLAIGKTSLAAEKKIDQLTKKDTGNEIAGNCKETNKIGVINVILHHNNLITNLYHQLIIHQDHKIKTVTINQLHNQCSKFAAPTSNPFNNTILPTQIAQNANFSDIFPFEFEANELPFLLSNAVVNKQKAITAMYTEATVERKPIQLILDNGSAGSIITYQLIQQLQRTVDRPAQTVIVIADDMKKTPVGEIDNFSFTIDRITIPVKVLVMDAPQY
ncbi:hypothetical protein G9A89_022297 [Geosiphon pyriformis]|nr:hypothetical protein G9A89_022297 [Geosiphon pyriformis]